MPRVYIFYTYVPVTLCHYKKYNAALTTTKWIFLLPTHSSLDLSSFFFCWYIFSIAHVRHDDDDDKKEKKIACIIPAQRLQMMKKLFSLS